MADNTYHTTRKECLATTWSVSLSHINIKGTQLPFERINIVSIGYWTLQVGQLAWWRLHLSEFCFDVLHQSGVERQAADSLSRLLINGTDELLLEDKISVYFVTLEIWMNPVVNYSLVLDGPSSITMLNLAEADFEDL